MGKILLPFLTLVLSGAQFSCTQVVTLPVRTVIDLTERPIEIESKSIIDLSEKSQAENANPVSTPEGP